MNPSGTDLESEVVALREENAELRRKLSLATGEKFVASSGTLGGFTFESNSNISEASSAKLWRNKDAIDMETGKKAYSAPQVDSFRNLFNQSDVLQFEEDSPSFRLKIDELEESVDDLRGLAEQLVDSCRRYCKHGNAASDSARTFSHLLKSLVSNHWTHRFGRVATLLAKFGDTFDEIESFREGLMRSLEETFCAPMEEFVRLEVKRVRTMKQDMQKASNELEASLVKYLRQRQSGGGSSVVGGSGVENQEKWDTELSVLRQSFELTRYDMVVELNAQKMNRKFQLCQRVCTSLFDFIGYFQECGSVMGTVQPTLTQLNKELSFARKEFSCQGMLYNLKRKLLLREVKRSSPALALMLPKKKRGSFQSVLRSSTVVAFLSCLMLYFSL